MTLREWDGRLPRSEIGIVFVRPLRLAPAVLLFLALATGARADAPTVPRPLDVAAIDAYVQRRMADDRVPGLALAVVRGNEVVHLRGFGTSGPGKGPVTPQTTFVLGSMSKSLTALAVMQLVEAGKLDLDAPVQKVLPWFVVGTPSEASQLTARHLLHHTSGIPRHPPRSENVLTIEAHVRALRAAKLVHPPGGVHQYSSANYQVLGHMVEVLSGLSFDEYIKRNVFAPLQMVHSYTSVEEAEKARHATGHQPWLGFPRATHLRHEADRLPTAALLSSAEDLAWVMLANLHQGQTEKGRVLSPSGMEELHRPAAKGKDFAYAMGWRVGPIAGETAIHHGGIVPHYRGKMVLFPEHELGVAVLTNVSTVLGKPTSHTIANGVAAIAVGKKPPRAGLTLSTLYLLVAGAMVLLLGDLVKDLVRLGRWRARLAELPHGLRPRMTKGVLPVALGIAAPLALVVGLPLVIGLSWAELVRHMPDVSIFLLGYCLLAVLINLWKARLAYVVLRKR